jgi:hypothetical protein
MEVNGGETTPPSRISSEGGDWGGETTPPSRISGERAREGSMVGRLVLQAMEEVVVNHLT